MDSNQLIDAIIEGIQRKKGNRIVNINLKKLETAECSNYIICHGTSNTQVDSIAHSIEDTVEEITGEKVWHRDGFQNSLWILLDYGNVMVHVFQETTRDFYDLENLWADAEITNIESNN